jgi:3-deoxy-D-manno-octulosonic-acid transferase
MPSARWPGKQWPVSRFVDVIQSLGAFPIVLGTGKDAASVELVSRLKTAGIPHFAAWATGDGNPSLKRTASLLSHAQVYLGCDTGLGHLAEAVGARAITLFGPTTPALGFGPWRERSRAVEPSLWCRPCGKDGRFCFRPVRRYHCQTLLKPEQVLEAIKGGPHHLGMPLAKNFLGRFYAWLLEHLVHPWILPRKFSQHRLEHRLKPEVLKIESATQEKTAWFHAASAGELESLWTVILKASQVFDSILVTGFSESIGERLQRLNASLAESARSVKWIGYSPCEGEWYESLKAARPSLFVTAKYEAWPELWLSLADLGIPLAIVGAQSRPSLKIAKLACAALGGEVPELHLLTARPKEGEQLEVLFPGARIRPTGDPRWDRVQQRAQGGSARARELVGTFQKWPRPWGVLGQVWEDDLKVWAAELSRVQGTLWVVPHRVDATHVEGLEKILTRAGLTVLRTSRLTGPELVARQPQTVILGDELGFLSELYAAVDWAYIGGGFTAGVHSTIEPAIHGIPLAAGPKNASKFPEIAELVDTGQLRLLSGAREVREWHAYALSVARSQAEGAPAEPWRRQALERLGSTDRVMQALAEAAHLSLG